MRLANIIHSTALVLLSCTWYAQGSTPKYTCPIGFSIAYTREKGEPICYKMKGPELFTDKYKDCAGNLYTSKLYLQLNYTSPNKILWTEYKSLYPGGTFIDWSYTKSMGKELDSPFEVNIDPILDIEEGLCVGINTVSNFTAVKCTDRHYRYCFIKPYPDDDDYSARGCDEFDDSLRLWGPVSTCVKALTGVGGGKIRATWRSAQELCAKRGASLLNRGWMYSNIAAFNTASNTTFPLGFIMSNLTHLRYDATDDYSEIPISEGKFDGSYNNSDNIYGAVRDDFWYLVNESFIFFDVICERRIPIKHLDMNIDIDLDNKITLTVNDSIDSDKLYCYTDSEKRYPVVVKKQRKDHTNSFVLIPKGDGYYWCTHTDVYNYNIAESNKVLFIREKQSIINKYAVKIKHNERFTLDDVDDLSDRWKDNLAEYIYLVNKYQEIYGKLDTNYTEEMLQSLLSLNPDLEKNKSTIHKKIVKRLYLDAQTVLLYVDLKPDLNPPLPGSWRGLEIVYMKPVYYCRGSDTSIIPLGNSIDAVGCVTHTCVGDFNDGVQLVATATPDCTGEFLVTTGSPAWKLPIDESDEENLDTTTEITTTEVRFQYAMTSTPDPGVVSTVTSPPSEVLTADPTNLPTTPVITTPSPTVVPPEQQLQQVMDNLYNLVNDSRPIFVDDIADVFDQVDDILEDRDNLEIPGKLLHLLDRLGSTVQLNGTNVVTAVRSNIALVMANVEPENPVRGIKIAARDSDVFTDDAFAVIGGDFNSTMLDSESNEAVVVLPTSVSDTSRRVSFVVFRTDRAFHDDDTRADPLDDQRNPRADTLAVNSRVLSVKVENLTHFQPGEVIDIHLSPLSANVSRNTSRACGYWEFRDDNTGYWSQEGCSFIASSQPGLLDTCRCTHLTHFAEILVPRSVFSEEHETILEILTVVGCCLSMLGLALVGTTAVLFRSWRREYSNKVWLQLCVAIFLLVLTFLIVIYAKFDEYNILCMLIGVALHYSVLASFCWMLVAAVLSYRRLVLVFTRDASHKLLRASAFSWGAPCAVVGILLSVAPHSYAGRFEEKSPSATFCYPSGVSLWVTVYAPICGIVLANWTLFVLIVRSVFASRRIQRHGDSKEAIRCASVSCLLVFLFGLPWVFGLFAYNIVGAYLFTLTAAYQGFILFLFFVLGNKKTRDLWLNKLKIKQTRKVPVTSSTFSNRSTNWRPNTNNSAETKVSKPKSLSTPDDSRFS